MGAQIYGIGPDDNDAECCLCLTEPRDTTILPCRHMCICHACARELRQRQVLSMSPFSVAPFFCESDNPGASTR